MPRFVMTATSTAAEGTGMRRDGRYLLPAVPVCAAAAGDLTPGTRHRAEMLACLAECSWAVS